MSKARNRLPSDSGATVHRHVHVDVVVVVGDLEVGEVDKAGVIGGVHVDDGDAGGGPVVELGAGGSVLHVDGGGVDAGGDDLGGGRGGREDGSGA